ncbi:MAG: GNAT family N-acetyltransferase [Hyphomonas sp.]
MTELEKYGSLVLREPGMGDLDRHFEIYGDLRANKHNPAGPLASPKDSRRMLQAWKDHWWKYGFGNWAVSTGDEPEDVIGFGGLSHRIINGKERINLGFRFAPEAWGKGYATQLGEAALHVAFDQLGLEAVHAFVRPGNLPSIRVLERLNMHQTETMEDVPDAAPSLVFEITADEAKARLRA